MTGRIILFSDTSQVGTGSSLWQYQEGKPRLIGYASKSLPKACQRYSATELEMTGLLVDMGLWKNILKHREFDAAVDHVAVTQIMKAKTEPASNRIMWLLDRLSAYSFALYYLKGKDMILADYLSHHRLQDEDPSELVLINFFQLYNIGHYMIATRSRARAAGEVAPEVHGANKPLDPTKKPEHQSYIHKQSPKASMKTPERQDTVKPQPVNMGKITSPPGNMQTALPKKVQAPYRAPRVPSAYNKSRMVPKRLFPIPSKSQSPEKGERVEAEMEIDMNQPSIDIEYEGRADSGIDLGETKEVLDPEIKIPQDEDFTEPKALDQVVDMNNKLYKFLPKQGEVNKILKQINHKILRDTKLPLTLKDLKAAYLTSPHFRDIYLHILQNRVPLNKSAVRKLEINARNYMILNGLLFKITEGANGEHDTVLCIPT